MCHIDVKHAHALLVLVGRFRLIVVLMVLYDKVRGTKCVPSSWEDSIIECVLADMARVGSLHSRISSMGFRNVRFAACVRDMVRALQQWWAFRVVTFDQAGHT